MKMMGMTASLTAATRRGDKTQTRRLPDPRKVTKVYGIENGIVTYGDKKNMTSKKTSIANFISEFATYKTGEIVAIREPAVIESYSIDATSGKCTIKYLYKADDDYERRIPETMELPERFFDEVRGVPTNWVRKHMGGVPNGCIAEMLRTFVRIVDVRLERLNEICYEDAKAEGIEIVSYLNPNNKLNPMYKNYDQRRKRFTYHNPIGSFHSLWESIEGKGTFDDRYVMVYVYEKTENGENTCG